MIKGTTHQEDTRIINIYALVVEAFDFIEQILLDKKGEIGPNATKVGDTNTPFSPMGRSSKLKIIKETSESNYTVNQMDLTDIYRLFHRTATKYTLSPLTKLQFKIFICIRGRMVLGEK